MIRVAALISAFAATMIDCVQVVMNRPDPIVRLEKLERPVAVTGWDSQGLFLADGRHLALPEVESLPANSAILTEAVRRGVEINPEGRVVGLVEIYHWCGNDPVVQEIVRVDLTRILQYMDSGGLLCGDKTRRKGCSNYSGALSRFGWWPTEYRHFRDWEEARRSAGR